MRALIKHGADVTGQDKTLSTPLHLAAFSGSSAAVYLLLEHGADVTILDERHKTPLHLALSSVSATTFSMLNQTSWGDTKAPNYRQFFYSELSEDRIRTVQLLIQHGAGVTVQDYDHSTPLHLASTSVIPDIVQLLIECGADVNAQDGSRRTPLHLVSSSVSFNSTLLSFQPDVKEG